MDISLQEGESIIKESTANHFKGVEGVGGKLFLTTQRVFFKSHALNIQTHEQSIPYSEIKSVGKRNTFFIIPNGMYVELLNGNKEKFVVFGRSKWISEIEQRIKKSI
ncbi:MAG: GRAM domain-containing protein [Candidatus Magasanikbacteria bacterium]